MEHDGGQCEKKNVYKCITRSLCCIAGIDRNLSINCNKNFLKIEKKKKRSFWSHCFFKKALLGKSPFPEEKSPPGPHLRRGLAASPTHPQTQRPPLAWLLGGAPWWVLAHPTIAWLFCLGTSSCHKEGRQSPKGVRKWTLELHWSSWNTESRVPEKKGCRGRVLEVWMKIYHNSSGKRKIFWIEW